MALEGGANGEPELGSLEGELHWACDVGEFIDAKLSIWALVVTFLAVGACTVGALSLVRLLQRSDTDQEEQTGVFVYA